MEAGIAPVPFADVNLLLYGLEGEAGSPNGLRSSKNRKELDIPLLL
jgi:hypothetical protein